MKPATEALEHASVKRYCKALRVPVIGANFVPLAEQAVKEKRNHIGYLEALLAMETEERDRHAVQSRLHDARLPRMKRWRSSTSIKPHTSQLPRSASSPREATSNAPNRWC